MKTDIKTLFEYNWKKPFQGAVKITPDDAKAVLDSHNGGNRYMRKGGSRYIAIQIKSGEWQSDHPQPICFSTEGKLLDGQHRMAGIVVAGEPVIANVRFGVDPNLVKYLDTGISRNLGDRVQFVENTTVNKFIASMLSLRFLTRTKGKPTPEQALSDFYAMKDSYIAIAELHTPRRYVGIAMVGLAFSDYHNKYGQEALEMYKELFKMTTDCQPAQALKSYLSTAKLDTNTLYPYIVSCCLANHDGRQVKVIRAASWR